MAAMNETIEECRRQAFLAEDLRPLGKGQVGSNRDAGALIAVGEKLEEELGRLTREGQVAQLVDEHQIEAPVVRQQARQAQLFLRQLQLSGQGRSGAEEHAVASQAEGTPQSNHEVRLAQT